MQFIFESRDPRGAGLRDIAEHRLRFVMRRIAWLVPRARIRLSDQNGPRGGVDNQCRLEPETERGRPIVVTATARDWRQAFENALNRGARVLARSRQRGREVARSRFDRGSGTAEAAADGMR